MAQTEHLHCLHNNIYSFIKYKYKFTHTHNVYMTDNRYLDFSSIIIDVIFNCIICSINTFIYNMKKLTSNVYSSSLSINVQPITQKTRLQIYQYLFFL